MNYLLIHGSWHGAWCWEKLTPLLEKERHQVQCLELPGSGTDAARAPEIVFDDLYAAAFDAILNAEKPVSVVAHSFAGFIAAQVCEKLHERIHHAYYIAAWLPSEGKTLIDLAVGYNNSDLPSIFVDCGNPRLRAVDPSGAKQLFYHDCNEADQEWGAQRLRPKGVQPDNQKMPRVVPTHLLSKSTYILCANDRVVNPVSQLDMAQRFGFKASQIRSINAGHSPFLSQPQKLSELLV